MSPSPLSHAVSFHISHSVCSRLSKEFTTPLQSQVEAALEAVVYGSCLAKSFQATLADVQHFVKSDGSPVTVADLAVQAAMLEVLLSHSKGHGIRAVAEESLESMSEDVLDLVVDQLNQRCPLSFLTKNTCQGDYPSHHDHSPGSSSSSCTEDLWTSDRVRRLFNSTLLMHQRDIDHFTESVQQQQQQPLHWSQSSYFVIDPIDGTKGFLRNLQFAVGLCLMHGQTGDVELSVIGCPNLPDGQMHPMRSSDADDNTQVQRSSGQIFYAVHNQGARCVSIQELLRRDSCPSVKVLRVAKTECPPPESLVCLESYEAQHTDFGLSQRMLLELGVNLEQRHVLRIDSMAKYALVARGDGHMMLRFPKGTYHEKVWDILPGVLIVEEAGGCISHADGTPIDGRRKVKLTNTTGILVTGVGGKQFHGTVLEAIRVARRKLESGR